MSYSEATVRIVGGLDRDDNVKHDTGKLKVISLFAGPGAGKSTTAAALFNLMKRERFDVELVTEVAKDYTYERGMKLLSDQTLVLAKQHHRLLRLKDEVEYVVTDSPFPLGLVYAQQPGRYQHLIDELWDDYDNYPFQLVRTRRPFVQSGRNQDFEEAVKLDARIEDIAVEYGSLEFPVMDPDNVDVEYQIIRSVMRAQGKLAPWEDAA